MVVRTEPPSNSVTVVYFPCRMDRSSPHAVQNQLLDYKGGTLYFYNNFLPLSIRCSVIHIFWIFPLQIQVFTHIVWSYTILKQEVKDGNVAILGIHTTIFLSELTFLTPLL
jgi:hypothetical protein